MACVLRVWGVLAPHRAAHLHGLRITPAARGDGQAVTELRGALPNQAALREVVRTLHALGVTVRSAACTPLRRPAGGGAADT